MSLCDTKHTLWNNMYEGEIANLPQEVNLGPDLKLEEEEQRTGLLSSNCCIFFLLSFFYAKCIFFIVNFTKKDEKKDIFEMMHFPMEIIKTETTKEIKEEKVNDSIILSKLVQETREIERKDANTAKKSRTIKGKRKKRDVIIKDKQEEQEDCIDVETISDEVPGNGLIYKYTDI